MANLVSSKTGPLHAPGLARHAVRVDTLPVVFERLDRLARMKLAAGMVPGLSIAVTGRQQLLWSGQYGCLDLAARKPVRPGTLFRLGPLAEPLVALALLRLVEEGRMDLDAPLSQYLPWAELPVFPGSGPITPHHLLSHTAGIVRRAGFSPEPFAEVRALRGTRAGFSPGEQYHYSSAGYQALALVLETAARQPFAEALRKRVLLPLGMLQSEPVITQDLRSNLAVTYRGFFDDRPLQVSHPLVPTVWEESRAPAATAGDMALFLRLLLNEGRSLLRPETFARMIAPVAPLSTGEQAGYGLLRTERDGRILLRLGGLGTGFGALALTDLTLGYGAVVLSNGPEPAWDLLDRLAGWIEQAARGEEPDPVPTLLKLDRVENAAEYAGTYACGRHVLRLLEVRGRLVLQNDRFRAPIERRSADCFCANHPAFDRFLIRFQREDGCIAGFDYGAEHYLREGWQARPAPPLPAGWEAFPGHYRAPSPALSNFRVIARSGRLFLVPPDGAEEPLFPLGPGEFRVGSDPDTPETLCFQCVTGGKAQVADYSGCEYFRTFTD